jgi:cold shock CspA family protein
MESANKVLEGVIKKVLNKGYGFIQSDELPEDLFFHFSAVE